MGWRGVDALAKGFQAGLHELVDHDGEELAGLELSDEQAVDLGRGAARAALAPLLWAAAVGGRWDTTRTAEFLGVSRQALHKRVRAGSLLALSGRGTSWFPVWQLDPDSRLVRPVVAQIVGAFRAADDQISSLVIAAWATAANASLDGSSPADWLAQGRAENVVATAAGRAALGLAA